MTTGKTKALTRQTFVERRTVESCRSSYNTSGEMKPSASGEALLAQSEQVG